MSPIIKWTPFYLTKHSQSTVGVHLYFLWHFQWCVAGKRLRTSETSATISWRRAKMWLAYRWGPIRVPVRRAWATADRDRSCKISEPKIAQITSAPLPWCPLCPLRVCKHLTGSLQLSFYHKPFPASEFSYFLTSAPYSQGFTLALNPLCRCLHWWPSQKDQKNWMFVVLSGNSNHKKWPTHCLGV